MSCTRVFEWHKWFKEGHQVVKNASSSERPLTRSTVFNVKELRQVGWGNCQFSWLSELIASYLAIKKDSIWKIITEDLGMWSLWKMMSRLLNQKYQACQDIIKHLQTVPDLFRSDITGDERWIFEYDSETKSQRSQWKSTSPKYKNHQEGSNDGAERRLRRTLPTTHRSRLKRDYFEW